MAPKIVKYSVVDAFTDSAFKGNPAAVCLLEEDRDDGWLQDVAREFSLPVTCFLTPITSESDSDAISNPRFRIRWFTTVSEVELCGHATLAASHALFTSGLIHSDVIEYVTVSGIMTAKKIREIKTHNVSTIQSCHTQECFFIELDFPSLASIEYNSDDISSISKALNGASIIDVRRKPAGDDLLVLLSSGEAVEEFQPQFDEIKKLPGRGIVITGVAPAGSGFDFYSRVFAPNFGVDEDYVCGSAHCALAPYWSKKLGKCNFVAYQVLTYQHNGVVISFSLINYRLDSQPSSRPGILNIHLDEQNQRVLLRGKAVTVMEGSLLV